MFTAKPAKPEPVKPKPEATDIDISKVIVVGGEDWRNAKITKTITANSNNSGTSVQYPLTGWASNGDSCNGFICFGHKAADGSFTGGKFDWLPERETAYHWGFKHIVDGYKGHTVPVSGEDCGVWILSIDKTERSNIVWFKWS